MEVLPSSGPSSASGSSPAPRNSTVVSTPSTGSLPPAAQTTLTLSAAALPTLRHSALAPATALPAAAQEDTRRPATATARRTRLMTLTRPHTPRHLLAAMQTSHADPAPRRCKNTGFHADPVSIAVTTLRSHSTTRLTDRTRTTLLGRGTDLAQSRFMISERQRDDHPLPTPHRSAIISKCPIIPPLKYNSLQDWRSLHKSAHFPICFFSCRWVASSIFTARSLLLPMQ